MPVLKEQERRKIVVASGYKGRGGINFLGGVHVSVTTIREALDAAIAADDGHGIRVWLEEPGYPTHAPEVPLHLR